MQLWLKRVLLVIVLGVLIYLSVQYHEPIIELVSDQERIRDWLADLGPLGPMGLIFLNALQVVIAPIPGNVMQVIAGYLFGWLPGTIYSIIGMALGGILAMSLARVFGRPLVYKLVGEKRTMRWEEVTHLDSLTVWVILMLGIFGDIPFFIAGLTTLPIWKIIGVAVLVRAPSVLISTAIGAGVIDWRSPWVLGSVVLMVLVALIAVRYQDRIEQWVDRTVLDRVLKQASKAPIEEAVAQLEAPQTPGKTTE
ncbi:MAG: VTT domain-containing protein [Chloroflexota bacterium]|nr:VTT domain-containing protein [Chloroflexota bacterium]